MKKMEIKNTNYGHVEYNGFHFNTCPKCGREIIPPRGKSRQTYRTCAWCCNTHKAGVRDQRIKEAERELLRLQGEESSGDDE